MFLIVFNIFDFFIFSYVLYFQLSSTIGGPLPGEARLRVLRRPIASSLTVGVHGVRPFCGCCRSIGLVLCKPRTLHITSYSPKYGAPGPWKMKVYGQITFSKYFIKNIFVKYYLKYSDTTLKLISYEF